MKGSQHNLTLLVGVYKAHSKNDLPMHKGLTVSKLSSVTSQLASLGTARFLQAAWLTPRDMLYIRSLCYSEVRGKRSEEHFEKAS